MKRLRSLISFRRNESRRKKLLEPMKSLKKRSRKWDNSDLRDIVEAIYIVNDRMLQLYDRMLQLHEKMLQLHDEVRKMQKVTSALTSRIGIFRKSDSRRQ